MRRLRRFVPPQHGAWAMLLLPYLAGVLTAGFRWPDIPLLLAWLSGYLLSYYASQALKTRRPGRFKSQMMWYGLSTALFAAPVILARPRVLLYAPIFAALLAVNACHAARRQERALVNDLVSVVESCLMVFVTATIAGVAPSETVLPFTATLLYFTGTVFYVKTMIRERGSILYYRTSIAYHVAAVVVALLLSRLLAALFAVLAIRAFVLPRRRLTPKQVGLLEIAACLFLGAAVLQ
ncbi:YwiC-like family protein [Actinoplanes sp. NPDC020271]|uniref:YwiC-like family protein n=1 Tax=Actinoplanes sp. NPDC020271 TaxID=3363896 RepID=UPI0037A15A98